MNHTNLPFPVDANAGQGARQQPATIRLTLFAAAIALCSVSSQASVVSATIYPSHAEVTWEESHSIKAGPSIIEIDELPVSLQARDLQVRTQGIPGTNIAQVQVIQVERESFVADETRRLQREIQNVSHLIQTDKDDIRAWQQQITLMTQSASQPGERSASELADMAEMLQQKTRQALGEIRETGKRIEENNVKKNRLERELAQVRQTAMASKKVRLRVQSPEAGELLTTLTFQTTNASWQSEYNARLNTELEGRPGGEITLEHLAVVQQTTGIDWSGVEVRLSTANALKVSAMPEPSTWVVSTGNPLSYARSDMAAPEAMIASSSLEKSAVRERQSPFTEHYRIPQSVDIPNGRSPQRLAVAQHTIAVGLATWVNPVKDTTGYLHATGVLESDASVPQGLVTLYRDNQSVGQSRLPQLANGTRFSLGFGVDDGVTVKVVNELEHKSQEGVWNSENIQRRQNRFEITNHHQGAVQVTVFDRLPVSQQDDITVEPLEVTEPVQRNTDDKKGVLSWERVIAPSQTLSIHSGFEIRVPEGQSLPNL